MHGCLTDKETSSSHRTPVTGAFRPAARTNLDAQRQLRILQFWIWPETEIECIHDQQVLHTQFVGHRGGT